jgi:hypothetical protein
MLDQFVEIPVFDLLEQARISTGKSRAYLMKGHWIKLDWDTAEANIYNPDPSCSSGDEYFRARDEFFPSTDEGTLQVGKLKTSMTCGWNVMVKLVPHLLILGVGNTASFLRSSSLLPLSSSGREKRETL